MFPIGAPGDAVDGAGMALEFADRFSALRIPDSDRRVAAGRRQVLSVGRKGQIIDRARVAFKRPYQLAVGQADQQNAKVVRRRHLAVAGNGQ